MIKVRYKPSLAIGVFLLGSLLASYLSAGILAGLIILEAGVIGAACCFRPFLIIENDKVSYVSLISNKIRKKTSTEALAAKSEGMRWFLRKSDFEQLALLLKKRTV